MRAASRSRVGMTTPASVRQRVGAGSCAGERGGDAGQGRDRKNGGTAVGAEIWVEDGGGRRRAVDTFRRFLRRQGFTLDADADWRLVIRAGPRRMLRWIGEQHRSRRRERESLADEVLLLDWPEDRLDAATMALWAAALQFRRSASDLPALAWEQGEANDPPTPAEPVRLPVALVLRTAGQVPVHIGYDPRVKSMSTPSPRGLRSARTRAAAELRGPAAGWRPGGG